jgi:hypothetical protein
MRQVKMIVTNEEQLKNPAIVYSVIIQWMREAGEDFIDCNESFIDGEDVLEWMINEEMITVEKYTYILDKKETWIQDLLLGYETGVLNGECQFPSNNKAYQIISDYISESKELREKFIYNFCTSFSDERGDKSRGVMSGSYDSDDGIPKCAHILDYDLEIGTMTKEEWLNQKWFADISFTDEYCYLKEMSFEEADRLSEELDK